MNKPRVAWCATTTGAVRAFARPFLVDLSQRYEVTLYANGSHDELGRGFPTGVAFVPVDIRRAIAPIADARALATLYRHFRRERYDLVHSLLPKAGLLAMHAAKLARVPHRIHLFTGQVWATRAGAMRALLKTIDSRTAAATTLTMADSPSQRAFLHEEGVARNVRVIGPGSVSGIESERFAPDPAAAALLRERLGIDRNTKVIGFVGRVNRDKGVPELLSAFGQAGLADDVHLVLFGPDEGEIELPSGEGAKRVHFAGPTDEVPALLPGMDLFCLPSFREGFGVSVIEASSCGIPVVASRIYGLTDAVVDGETGWLVPPGDVDALAATLREAMANPEERARRGAAGRERAVEKFATADFVKEMAEIYADRLGHR